MIRRSDEKKLGLDICLGYYRVPRYRVPVEFFASRDQNKLGWYRVGRWPSRLRGGVARRDILACRTKRGFGFWNACDDNLGILC
jgi:hypothetical protein